MNSSISARSTRLGAVVTLLLALAPQRAAAEVSSAQRATAEALFQQATQLMTEKRYVEACEKFAASQELDAGLGTMLYLADCYDQAGRTASAWALFREAEDAAHRAGQDDRRLIAVERAKNLEARLSRIELRVPSARDVAGLELSVNSAAVPRASWNVPLPMDPGTIHVEARAPGKKPWRIELSVAEGPAGQVVEIPKLLDAPRAAASKATSSTPVAPASNAQRTGGYVAGAVGVAALVVGGFFGYRAYTLNKQSKSDCRAGDPNACTPEGASTRANAQSAAALSTIASLSGGLLVAGGVVLIATAPTSSIATGAGARPSQAALPAFGFNVRGTW